MRNAKPTWILFFWASVRRNYVWTRLGNYTLNNNNTQHNTYNMSFQIVFSLIQNTIETVELITVFLQKTNAYEKHVKHCIS